MSKNKNKGGVGELEVKYDGRCLKFEVIINTDEPDFALAERLQKAASGPGQRMALVMGGVLEPEDAKTVWDKVLPMMKNAARKHGGFGN